MRISCKRIEDRVNQTHKVKLIEPRALNRFRASVERKNGESFRILRKFTQQIETATLQEFCITQKKKKKNKAEKEEEEEKSKENVCEYEQMKKC